MSEEKKQKSDEIKEFGALMLNENKKNYKIRLLTIIGEIEGHETVSNNTKATKYEHLLPQLAEAEESDEVEGVLILLNTLGGDVEAGLAIAEMIASLGKPTVSLVLGGSHSIGGPLAVSADYSFVTQSLRNMERTQDRIARFIAAHSKITEKRLVDLMLNPTQLVKDVGTLLEGEEAVREGIIDEVGGIHQAFKKLYELIDEKREKPSEM